MARNSILFYGAMALVFACQKHADFPETTNVSPLPEMESWGSKISISTENQLNVVITAGHIFQHSEEQIIHFDNHISVDFYNPKNWHLSNLIANTATLNKLTNDMNALGNVFVKTDSGLVLVTTSLSFDSQRERIYTEDRVEFHTTNDTLWGVGFESDVNLENWKIGKPSGKFQND